MKIGYQGIEGAFSSIAARFFAVQHPNASYFGYPRFIDVFDALDTNKIDYAALPIENSYAGRVADVHNLIERREVYFCAEYILKIEHNLLAKKGLKIEEIEEVQSHEQAIMQCENSLKKLFSGRNVNIVAMEDTAIAAKRVSESERGNLACISSSLAASVYGLNTLVPSIQDSQVNSTTFILISKKKPNIRHEPDQKYVTSILFQVKNIPGAIFYALKGFAENGVDLLKLESYIAGGINSTSAHFFISFMGHEDAPNVQKALNSLKDTSTAIRIFGSYLSDQKRLTI